MVKYPFPLHGSAEGFGMLQCLQGKTIADPRKDPSRGLAHTLLDYFALNKFAQGMSATRTLTKTVAPSSDGWGTKGTFENILQSTKWGTIRDDNGAVERCTIEEERNA